MQLRSRGRIRGLGQSTFGHHYAGHGHPPLPSRSTGSRKTAHHYSIFASSQDVPLASFTTGFTYSVTGLSTNSSYSCSVVGTDSQGNQFGVGNQISATTWSNFLGPTQATAVDSQTIKLIWTYNPGPTFNIYYQAGSAPTISGGVPAVLLPPKQTTLQADGVNVSGLLPNTTYYFMVAAKYSDGTDSFQDSQTSLGTVSAFITGSGTLQTLPTITTQSILDTSTAPSFTVTGGANTYVLTFYLFDPTQPLGRGAQIASTQGNGTVTAAAPLPSGTQNIVVTIHDAAESSGTDATATLNGITVVPSLPNNGLKIVSAMTPSALSPLPKITYNPISLGPFPEFTVSGAQPGYVTTLYNSSNTIIGSVTGSGSFKVLSSAPLSQGLNTLYAVVSYGGDSATINGIQVRVKTLDPSPVYASSGMNAGSGQQGFGNTMAVGDFNCDGFPDIAVGAPYGRYGAIYVYYGKTDSSGLDFSAAPSQTPTGTQPLFVAFSGLGNAAYFANWVPPTIGGSETAVSLAVGNFNGYHDPITGNACSDLAVGAPALNDGYGYDAGGVFVFYGSPQGLQANNGFVTPNNIPSNQLTCVGYSCTPVSLQYWSAGVPYTTNGPNDSFGVESLGVSVAAGDIDGDGYDDLVIGDPAGEFDGVGFGGAIFIWKGTPGGLSPNFKQVLFPTSLTESGGTSVNADFGQSVAIGHFVTSQIGSGGPADIALGFHALGSGATGISNPSTQSGVLVIVDGTNISVDSTNHFVGSNYVLVTPPHCNSATTSATVGAGWYLTSWCPFGGSATYWTYGGIQAADVNGDNYDDLIFGGYSLTPSSSWGEFFVYYGQAGLANFVAEAATTPTTAATCTGGSTCLTPQLFYSTNSAVATLFPIANLGDVNHDGYNDIGAVAFTSNSGAMTADGVAFVYHGGANGLTGTALTTLAPQKSSYSFFGSSMVGANFESATGFKHWHDGTPAYNDLVVGAQGESLPSAARTNGVITNSTPPDGSASNLGTASIYTNPGTGSGFGVSLGAANTILSPVNSQPSNLAAGVTVLVGDVNGDGYADAVMRVSLPAPPSSLLEAVQTSFVVYYGGPAGLNTSEVPSINPLPGTTNPQLVLPSVFYPSYQGANAFQPDWNIASNIIPAGDTNGDGFADVAVGSNSSMIFGPWPSYMFLFYGSPSGLIVAPPPVAVPYNGSARPSLNPMKVSGIMASLPTNGASIFMPYVTSGDFNGDGYSDIALFNNTSDIVVIYGSSLGLVAEGDVWFDGTDVYYDYSSQWAAADDADRLHSTPTCTTTAPIVCYPLIISHTLIPGATGVMNAGDMDGDGTDDLVSLNGEDSWNSTGWGSWPGTITIFYGGASGIDPNINVNLRLPFTAVTRGLGGNGAGRGYDINNDGYADLVLKSNTENAGYVIYGVHGPGTHPTASTGAYIQQGLCTSFPCTLTMTSVTTPDYNPGHLLTTSSNSSCSLALDSCNPMKFDDHNLGATGNYGGIFGLGDITGDGYGEVVVSDPSLIQNGGYWGQAYIFSGSPSGLQVTGTPTTTPSCYVSGGCDPYLITLPEPFLNILTSGAYAYWTAAGGPFAADVDGDGTNDFVFTSGSINSLDGNGNITGTNMGGFYLFH